MRSALRAASRILFVLDRGDGDDERLGCLQERGERFVSRHVELGRDLTCPGLVDIEEARHLDAGEIPEDAGVVESETAHARDAHPKGGATGGHQTVIPRSLLRMNSSRVRTSSTSPSSFSAWSTPWVTLNLD